MHPSLPFQPLNAAIAVRPARRSAIRFALGVVAAATLGICAAYMRGMQPAVIVDPVSGCQYLQSGLLGTQMTPRLGTNGKPICAPARQRPREQST